jgi:hypothetical protein
MARIRTIKPEFFTSEDICSLDFATRLLYIALWCEADKEGRLTWKPRTFKLRYFPADDCNIDALARQLVDAGLVCLYGDGLAYIPSFTTHQHVNPRESASLLPQPPGVADSGPKKIGKNVRAFVIERDGGACVRCGSTDRIELDHILPQSCGGPHIAENLRVLCKSCNAGRPVCGDALDEDLARDGFTVHSLRVKFGIDASTPEVHAQVGREGKGRERKEIDASATPPSAPTKRKQSKTAMPENFEVSDRVKAWAASKGFDRLPEHLESFRGKARAKGYVYVDWDAAFMEAVREDWAGLRNGRVVPLPFGGTPAPAVSRQYEDL